MSTCSEEYKYKITAVIPVYNVEDYLEETLESVINQDIGFKENIQIILVNDGSKDDSEKICRAYQKKYPDNITYIYQENSGVSCARNNGISYAEGKYINVFDSDDIWSLDTYSKAYNFFEAHYDEIDVVSCKIIHFEAASHVHVLSRTKHHRDRIVNIHNNYDELQNHAAPCLIKTEAARKFKYLEEMRYGEDSLYINKIILEKEQYGVLADPVYYYRKRFAGTSAVQNKHKSFEWFLETPLTFYGALMELSRQKFGEVIPYYQNLFVYELQWRLREAVNDVLDEKQKLEYHRIIRTLLQECEDDIITTQARVYTNEKIFLLSLKYGRDIRKELICMNDKLYFNNIAICNLNTIMTIRADIVDVKASDLIIEGRVLTMLEPFMKFWFEDEEGRQYPIEKEPTFCGEAEFLGITVVHPQKFAISLPLKEGRTYQLCGSFHQHRFTSKVAFGKFGKINGKSKYTYYENDDFLITVDNNLVRASSNTIENRKKWEALLTEDIKAGIKSGNWSDTEIAAAKQGLKLRKRYWRKKKSQKKKIWLISDRVNYAGDNGEAFFEYMKNHPDKTIEAYYVISATSKDYKRMKKLGNVIKYKSTKHLLYTLLADKVISSHAEDHIGNPFEAAAPFVRSLCHFDMVFLQHGITKDDLSSWLNKFHKNLGLFITAAKPEYDSIVQNEYNYEEEKVALTGFARYDRLVQKDPAKKEIIFLPTWRPSLASEMDPKTGDRAYNPAFAESEFYHFYNRLINDERILTAMKKKGYTGKFCLHQNNIANVGDFDGNDVIRIQKEGITYRDEFLNNSLLITDYSSVAYDFAYLKKPVIYIQFDREEFFEHAVYDKGYWDYKRDGFGPVCEEYEKAVETIIETIERDCKMQRTYEERLEKFYLAFDQNNSKRIYDAICNMGKCSKEEK
ncbi:MAG: CDP-glycerol glycerophosphotransferase family protein [bacterium]|nr:CDP-glycerol glycerophosphotransferase family protein [bacterium]